jgi:glucosamine--fructose-6-phosphate aminotransferase (isomerizing)
MCGVFGYVGQETDVGSAVVSALKRLEYRGYDSWGLAIATPDGFVLDKAVGRINGHCHAYPAARQGLGHTRWATHGGVTVANAHPHLDCSGRVVVVHNGIVENFRSLREQLASRGHHFASDTDSEAIAHLVEDALADCEDLLAALARCFRQLDGYNAVVVMDRNSGRIAGVKRLSPLVVGLGQGRSTIASDPIALHGHADTMIPLEDDQIAALTPDGVQIFDLHSMRPIDRVAVPVCESASTHALGDYPDFMSKEIAEQPTVLRRLVAEGRDEIEALASAMRKARRGVLVGCGTAANAALAGTYIFDELCQRDMPAIAASEFRFRSGTTDAGTLVVALSQSGETLDVIEAMRSARLAGARLSAIVNAEQSTLARMVDQRLLLRAGPEQCVLATKSYVAKLAGLLLVAHSLRGDWATGAAAVHSAATAIETLLAGAAREQIRRLAARIASSPHLFVVGRGVHVASAFETALKIKEVSYIHAEGFAGGELKHGVIALIEPGTPCLVFAPDDDTRADALSCASELRSRAGYTIGIGSAPDAAFDDFIHVPDVGIATPIVEAVPGQVLAYYAALARGNDPDRPRNLAKSVTVK